MKLKKLTSNYNSLQKLNTMCPDAPRLNTSRLYTKIMTDNNIIYISIGDNCYVASALKSLGLRKCSYPFDWVLSTHDVSCSTSPAQYYPNKEQQSGVFSLFLSIIECNSIDDLCKSFFDLSTNETYIQNWDNRTVFVNKEYCLSFPHDDITTIEDTFRRRFKRLKDDFFSANIVRLVFATRPIRKEYDDLLRFLERVSDIKESNSSGCVEIYTVNIEQGFPWKNIKQGFAYYPYDLLEKAYIENDWTYDNEYSRLVTIELSNMLIYGFIPKFFPSS
jgi:hypothetical protein